MSAYEKITGRSFSRLRFSAPKSKRNLSHIFDHFLNTLHYATVLLTDSSPLCGLHDGQVHVFGALVIKFMQTNFFSLFFLFCSCLVFFACLAAQWKPRWISRFYSRMSWWQAGQGSTLSLWYFLYYQWIGPVKMKDRLTLDDPVIPSGVGKTWDTVCCNLRGNK